jgi:hypothetical protein
MIVIKERHKIFVASLLVMMPLAIAWAPLSFSPFPVSVSAANGQLTSSVPPEARLLYNNHEFAMSPFIFVQEGQLNKVQFPALPGDTDPIVTVQPGSTVNFGFNSKPTKIEAFITDYDGDTPSVHTLKKVGPSSFEISGVPGVWQIEVHATFANSLYASYTALANVQGTNSSLGSQALAQQAPCGVQDRLQVAAVMDSSNNNNNNNNAVVMALNNGNNNNSSANPIWSVTGKGSWVQLDLGQEKSICNLQIGFPDGDKTIKSFTILTSTDGVHFVSHGSVQNTGMISGNEQFSFSDSPIPARFVKLSFDGSTNGELYNISNLKVTGS